MKILFLKKTRLIMQNCDKCARLEKDKEELLEIIKIALNTYVTLIRSIEATAVSMSKRLPK